MKTLIFFFFTVNFLTKKNLHAIFTVYGIQQGTDSGTYIAHSPLKL